MTEDRQEDGIDDQIAESMFAILLDLNKQIRKITTEAGIEDEEDEWVDDASG